MIEEHKETGELAYEAYRYAKGNYDRGNWMPPWEQVPETEQDCWRAAAHNAIRKGWFESQRSPRRKKWRGRKWSADSARNAGTGHHG